MVVAPDGQVSGSVSGGCVEGAVYELANDVVREGTPRLERYGISDDDAFAVGLTCGGILDVFVEPVSQRTFPELADVADDIAAHRPVAVATVITHVDPAWVGGVAPTPGAGDQSPAGGAVLWACGPAAFSPHVARPSCSGSQ